MVDPIGLLQCIDSAVRRFEELERLRKHFKANPGRVENLRERFLRLSSLVKAKVRDLEILPPAWQDALNDADVYFGTARDELARLSRDLESRAARVRMFFKATDISETIAVLTAGLERLEIKLLIIDDSAHRRSDSDTRWSEMYEELPARLRVMVIEAIGTHMSRIQPQTHEAMNRAANEAAKELLLTTFDQLKAQTDRQRQQSQRAPSSDALAVENYEADEEAVERLMDGLDKSVAAVTKDIQSTKAFPDDVKRNFEELIERLWEPWRVNPSEIEFSRVPDGFGGQKMEMVGQGSTGAVYKASVTAVKGKTREEDTSKIVVAVKMMDLTHLHSSLKADFLREVEMLSELQHPCIVQFHGAFWPRDDSESDALVLMELMDGNVAELKAKGRLSSRIQLLKVLGDVAEGLEYMHGRGIAHMDIKPQNVLARLDREGNIVGRAKLADFGVSQKKRVTLSQTLLRTGRAVGGTLMYMPPESRVQFAKARPSCDAWSYGVMMCELLVTNREKLSGLFQMSAHELAAAAHNGTLYRTIEELMGSIDEPLLRSLGLSCLSREPERRPSFSDIRLNLIAARLSLSRDWVNRLAGRTAECLYWIGFQTFLGLDLTRNTSDAMIWLTISELLGNADAHDMMKLCFDESTNQFKSLVSIARTLGQGASASDPNGQYFLGWLNALGLGVPQDIISAMALFHGAAERGHSGSMVLLGRFLETGLGLHRKHVGSTVSASVEGANESSGRYRFSFDEGNDIGAVNDLSRALELYKQAAAAGDAEAMLSLGDCYRKGVKVERDIQRAVVLYEQAALAGHPCAQYVLGTCYYSGIGVSEDVAKAVSMYRKAAEAGHAGAQNNLGICYEDGIGVTKDAAKAVALYRKAADAGHADAQKSLGHCYQNGTGVARDATKGVALYKRAADVGHAGALLNLGYCYQNGIGVTKDACKAVAQYENAAEAGHIGANICLGYCYQNGIGVAKDVSKAVGLYQQAAFAGSARGQRNLGYCYQNGIGVAKDATKAVALYQKAADAGHTGAYVCLGYCFQNGVGVTKDAAKAVALYQRAADAGHTGAYVCLGYCFQNGIGVATDAIKAVAFYRQAANSGHADAQNSLAFFYLNGVGVERDVSKAVGLYKQAADAGQADAHKSLGFCYENGIGVAKDVAKAEALYRQAANSSSSIAPSPHRNASFAP